MDTPSPFVASLAHVLATRKGDDAHRCADLIRDHGVMTGREFNRLVENISDPRIGAELLWAYSFISKEAVDVDFAQGVPALITLAEKALTSPVSFDEVSQKRLFRILERLLYSRIHSADIAAHLKASVSDSECLKLQNIASQGFQDRKGYWESVELLSTVYPDPTSLEHVFRGVDRLLASSLKRSERRGVERCISVVAAADFVGAFEFVARALHRENRPADSDLRRAAARGFAFHADKVIGAIGRFLNSDSEAEALLACLVCVRAGKHHENRLSMAKRDELAQQVRLLVNSLPYRTESPQLYDESLRALSHISNECSDIESVGFEVRQRLASGEPLPSSLVLAYAEGLSGLDGAPAMVGVRAPSHKMLRLLTAPLSLVHHISRRERLLVRPDTEGVFENLAIDIGCTTRFEDVVSMCHRHARFVDSRSLRARDSGALSLFSDVVEAARFSKFYVELCEKGPGEFAAILLPELLSALTQGRDTDNHMCGVCIGENATRSLASLARLLVNDPHAQELASARLSQADWGLLESFHKRDLREYPDAHPELGLVMFALRSVFEDDEKTWQRDFMAWWVKVDHALREQVDPNALAFLSVVAEQRRPGAMWDLLSRVSLVPESANTLRGLAMGLLIRPDLWVKKVCEMVQSPRGDELARGLVLSQLLTRYLHEEQRSCVLGVARRSLDEVGILAFYAIATIGVLSSSRDDAAMLLDAEPYLWFDESMYRVSCARAAAQVLQNRERHTGASSQ